MAGPPLPEFYTQVAPELGRVRFSEETAATCATCPMASVQVGAHGNQLVFTAKPRCCTYHPTLSNFIVGRVLRRGDAGAVKMLARLQDSDGVGPLGVRADRASSAYYAAHMNEFGRMELTCPYWSDAAHGCTIHANRNSVCRTWHCKHVEGDAGWRVWSATKDVLGWIEDRLGRCAVAAGDPPAGDADRDAWIAWFLWCATWVEEQGGEALRALRETELEERLARLAEAVTARDDTPMPDILGATIRDYELLEDVVRMTAYSTYDTHELPRDVFRFLSKLDGETTWWEALVAAEAEGGVKIGADVVRTLWRAGMLGVPLPKPPPGMSGKVILVETPAERPE